MKKDVKPAAKLKNRYASLAYDDDEEVKDGTPTAGTYPTTQTTNYSNYQSTPQNQI